MQQGKLLNACLTLEIFGGGGYGPINLLDVSIGLSNTDCIYKMHKILVLLAPTD